VFACFLFVYLGGFLHECFPLKKQSMAFLYACVFVCNLLFYLHDDAFCAVVELGLVV